MCPVFFRRLSKIYESKEKRDVVREGACAKWLRQLCAAIEMVLLRVNHLCPTMRVSSGKFHGKHAFLSNMIRIWARHIRGNRRLKDIARPSHSFGCHKSLSIPELYQPPTGSSSSISISGSLGSGSGNGSASCSMTGSIGVSTAPLGSFNRSSTSSKYSSASYCA